MVRTGHELFYVTVLIVNSYKGELNHERTVKTPSPLRIQPESFQVLVFSLCLLRLAHLARFYKALLALPGCEDG